MRFLSLFIILLTISACSGVGLSSKPNAVIYDLTAADSISNTGHKLSRQLIVAEPKALDFIKGEEIPVKNVETGTFSYLPTARYTDALPKILQSQIIEALENGGALGRVGVPGESLRSDLLLVTQIRQFYIEESAGSMVANISLSAKIINDQNGAVLAAKSFSNQVDVRSKTPSGMMNALDQALAPTLQSLTSWTLSNF